MDTDSSQWILVADRWSLDAGCPIRESPCCRLPLTLHLLPPLPLPLSLVTVTTTVTDTDTDTATGTGADARRHATLYQMESARYDWVLLDADGTLFDFDRAQRAALEATATAHGLGYLDTVHDAFVRVCEGVWARFERGEITADRLRVERFEDLLRELGVDGNAARLSIDYVRELAGHADLLPGAEQVVARLARRARLLLVTNGLAEVQRARFGVSPIRRFFADVVISDEIGVAKPQEGFLDVAFDRMGGPPRDRVLMVGDSLSADIEAGARYGLDTCWFNPRGLPLDGGPTPTYTIARLAEIEAIVSRGRDAAARV